MAGSFRFGRSKTREARPRLKVDSSRARRRRRSKEVGVKPPCRIGTIEFTIDEFPLREGTSLPINSRGRIEWLSSRSIRVGMEIVSSEHRAVDRRARDS